MSLPDTPTTLPKMRAAPQERVTPTMRRNTMWRTESRGRIYLKASLTCTKVCGGGGKRTGNVVVIPITTPFF